MQLHNSDVTALVVSTGDNWKTVCVTEYTKDGSWYNGLNIITSLEDVMKTAWTHKLNIIPESVMQDGGNFQPAAP
jgi:hypothetical protein